MKIEDNRSNVRTFSDLIVGDWFFGESEIPKDTVEAWNRRDKE